MAGEGDLGGISASIRLDDGEMAAKLDKARAAMERAAKNLSDLESRSNAAGAAMARAVTSTNQVVAGMNGIGVSANQAAYKLQIIGQGLDDLQYVGSMGLRPIINNLMQLSAPLGIAAIGINLLYTNWSSIATLFGSGSTKTEAERMDDLAKATNKTVQETRDLLEYKTKMSQIEAMKGGKSEAVKGQEGAVQKAIDESGGAESMIDALVSIRGTGAEKLDPNNPAYQEREKKKKEAADLHKDIKAGVYGEDTASAYQQLEIINEQIKQAYQDQRKAMIARAEGDLRRAKHGAEGKDAQREAELGVLIGEVEKNPKAFAKGTLDELKAARPSTRAAGERAALEHEAAENMAEFDAKTAKEKEAKAKERQQKANTEADALAHDLQGRFEAGGGTMGRDAIKDALVTSGKTEQEADAWADAILTSLTKAFDKKVRARSLASGLGLGDAKAELMAESDEKKFKDVEAKAGKAASAARKMMPDVDKATETGLMLGQLNNGKFADVVAGLAASLEQKLLEKGMDPEQAKAASKKIVAEDVDKLDAKVRQNDVTRKPLKAPEVVGSAEFRNKVQAGGFDDTNKKHLDVSKAMLDKLTEIKRGLDGGMRGRLT